MSLGFYLWFLTGWSSFAWAEDLTIRIALDDRQLHRLQSPVVSIGGIQTGLLDNGQLSGDVAGDGIYVAETVVQRQETLLIEVVDFENAIGSLQVNVPMTPSATFQLKTSQTGIVLDLNAPDMPIVEKKGGKTRKTMDALEILAQSREGDWIAPNSTLVVISLDARSREVTSPILSLQDAPEWIALKDDGVLKGDVADDGIWMGELQLPSTDAFVANLADGTEVLRELKIALPSTPQALLNLTYNQYGVSAVGQSQSQSTEMVVQATPKGDSSTDSDRIALGVFLDDRLLKRLSKPILKVDQENFKTVQFRDDGQNDDEEAEDHVWLVSTVIGREEFVEMQVLDDAIDQGKLTVFLPSTSEAVVWLRTTENGVKLVTEPTQSTTGGTTATGNSQENTVSSDKLAHVLWVMIGLFGLLFVYIRTVIEHYWHGEVQPILHKMDRFVEQQSQKQEQEDGTQSTDP